MWLFKTRVGGLSFCTLIFAIVVISLFAFQVRTLLPELKLSHWVASFWFFDKFYLDFLVFLLTGSLLINGGIFLRLLAYAWSLIFFTSYVFQYMAFRIGGEFVTFLAVDNINHISLLLNQRSIISTTALGIFFLLLVGFTEIRANRKMSRAGLVFHCCILGALATAVSMHESWLAPETIALRDGYFDSRENRLAHKSPVESLYKVFFREDDKALKPLSSEDVAAAGEFGINIRPENRYPLIKQAIYSDALPFAQSVTNRERMNVIVFMAEGMSARTLDPYRSFAPGLTPNLLDYSQDAMVVKNYYNHTYATYRGLLGQFCSIFPTRGGLGGWHDHYDTVKRIRYFCLTDLVNQAGYRSLFLDTHRAKSGYVDEMMAEIGFSEVMTAEDIDQRYLGEEPLRRDSLSDHQLMRGLVKVLKDLEKDASGQPFFLSLYNLETHALQKPARDGKRYSSRSSYVLDSIHNFDSAFGLFWTYFKASKLASNTIVVFTADHAHYPDQDFVALAGKDPDYQSYFIDQIPLMIWDPSRVLPGEFDANFASSINFAPTLAHWLGLENQKNPFIGSSLFDGSDSRAPVSFASADFEHYLIKPSGIEKHQADGENSDSLEFASYLIETIRQLEQHDRIWPE